MINIVEGVRKVIAFHLGAADAMMTEDAKLAELGADSLDVYEIAMSLEEKFNIPSATTRRIISSRSATRLRSSKARLADWSRTAGRRFLGT